MSVKRDEVLEELWAVRQRLAAKCGYDPRRQVREIGLRQAKEKGRIYSRARTLAGVK